MDLSLVIVTVTGLTTTLIGAILGPQFLDKRRRLLDQQIREQNARERPYVDFATAVERTQLDLDMLASGVEIDHEQYVTNFRRMEEARSVLDLVGTQSVRVWAYRCRISITSMNRDFHLPDRRNHYRNKLHEARAEFVTYGRAEVGVVTETPPTPVSASEDSAASHLRWLDDDIDDVDAKRAVGVSLVEFEMWSRVQEDVKSSDSR